jgi:histidine triad (HIT) family protein
MEDGAYSGCVFCRIVAGVAPAQIVHSSDRVLAFRDLNPQAPVHLLLIPKEHIASVAEIEEGHGGTLAELFIAAAHLAKAEGVDRAGWRIVTNVGSDAGQSVDHLHFHLLGGRRMAWPPG